MRRLFIVSAIALVSVVAGGTAVADYVYPGRIIIGYGGIKPISGTTNAAFIEECVLKGPVECECFPGVPVFEACVQSGAEMQCLTPDTYYVDVEQKEPVVLELGMHQLSDVVCTGKSDATAYIRLPLPQGG
jgi:hypothetical protein